MAINKAKITETAQKYVSKGQFDKAIAEYKKILAAEPNDIRTWLRVGDLYTRMGARSEATDTYLRVAEQYRKGGFHLKAVAVYKQIIRIDPLNTAVYALLADSYLSLGLTSDALIQLEQLADLAERQNKLLALHEALERMVSLDPDNITTRLRFAGCLLQENLERDALEQFLHVAQALRAAERNEEFVKVAQQVVRLDPSQVDIGQHAARLLLDRRLSKPALAILQPVFRFDRENETTLQLLVEAFTQLEHSEKALSVYKELVRIARRRGDDDAVRRYCQGALTLDPGAEFARKALEAVGGGDAVVTPDATADAAATAVAKMLEEVDVLLKYGLVDRAKSHFDKIFLLDYYNMEARERFADLLLRQGDVEGAKEQLFILVECFEKTQPEGAVYYLHQVLGMDPRSKRARAKLKEIGGVLPEGLPDIDEDDAGASGLLPVAEIAVDTAGASVPPPAAEISIEDIPYVDDAPVLIEEDSEVAILSPDEAPRSLVPPPPKPSVAPPASLPPLPKPSLVPPPPPESAGTGVSTPPLPPAPEPTRPSRPAPPPSSVPAAPAVPAEEVDDITGDIEEIRFFLDQGLVDEGRAIFDDIRERHPDDPRIAALAEEFAACEQDITASQKAVDSALDELSEELHLDEVEATGPVAVEEVFTKFKAGVEAQVPQTDYDTHFDLGQAYKEMGLWDDAIGEFRLAVASPERGATAQLMIGLCHIGAGRFDEAVSTFEEALASDSLRESERLALMYEKGKVLEVLGRVEDAIAMYNQILTIDPGFADVVDRIDTLE